MESKHPSCQVQQNAVNPMGQRHTMAGTTGVWNPPNAGMHTTKNMAVTPNSDLGVKSVEKK